MNRRLLTSVLIITGMIFILMATGATFIRSPLHAQDSISPPSEMLTRQERGEKVLTSLTGTEGLPPHFQQLKQDFPELADITLKYALGDIWGREVLDNKTRQLISLAGFAAQGTMPQFKIHAQYALNNEVIPEELMEIVYLTTVTSGFPRALSSAGILKELFQENNVSFPVASPN